jgi:hypothetical protein
MPFPPARPPRRRDALAIATSLFLSFLFTAVTPAPSSFAAAPAPAGKIRPSTYGTLTGTVRDAVTASPLAGASVTTSGGASATADAAGRYTIGSVVAGTYTVTASASGHVAASQTATVGKQQTVTADFSLAPTSTTGGGSGPTAPGSTIPWNGSDTYLLGVNYAWWNYGTDFGTGGWGKYTDWNAVAGHFAAMKTQGARVVRWWLFGDGRYAPDFSADGSVSGLDANVLPDIDRALQIAADNDLYLMFVVVDGGMWGGASYSGSVQMGGHGALITSAAAQQSFLDNALRPVLQRVAASPNAKRVLAWDIVNEPESQMAGYWGGVNLDPAAVKTFVQRSAAYVHQYGGGAYATVGSATPYYVGTWKGLGLDFYQFHYYPWMDFSNGAGSGLPTYASLNLDRPCVVGEFPTNDASYGPSDTAPLSARWYLDSVYAKGYAGALAWSTNVGDSATNWSAFQPVFTSWAQAYSLFVGPR